MVSAIKRTALAAVIAVAGVSTSARAAEVIKIDGSSTVYPVTEAVAEEFGSQSGGKTRITVGISGTGGGFKKFVRGETDIQDASRPILDTEMADAKKNGINYLELPVAFDALTVVVSKQNDWVDHFTVDELKKIWEPGAQGKIMKWSDVRSSWPDTPLKLYGPGADSGTFDYFTEAIVGKSKSSRGDYTASEDDNVLVQGVSGDRAALGYFGFAYFAENADKLKAVPVVNPATKKPVAPSEQSVMDATYEPLARPIFIYVNTKSLQRPEVRQFVEFYLKEGADLAKEVKYIPLPENAYQKLLARVKDGSTGTAYGGKAEAGVKIDELLQRELKN